VFGILTSRFTVFQKPIPLEPEKVEKVVLASYVLHNFLRSSQETFIHHHNILIVKIVRMDLLLRQNGDSP
jgi:hypothetical protein